MTIQLSLFYIFATILIVSALKVITAKNPVHSVLFLILAFFNAASLLVMQGAEFLAMILVIVYVGAVAILFLFVVMMLNVNFVKMYEKFSSYLPLGLIIAAILFLEIYLALKFSLVNYSSKVAVNPLHFAELDNTKSIGMVLYTDFIYPFQLSGVILLVAMIGAIILTHRKRKGVRKQNISEQVNRDSKASITLVKLNPNNQE
jgi:NADH-quinone oxidoreductase subunit J